jgi:hypothetical protein
LRRRRVPGFAARGRDLFDDPGSAPRNGGRATSLRDAGRVENIVAVVTIA